MSPVIRRRRLGAIAVAMALFAGGFLLLAPTASAASGDVLFILKYVEGTTDLRQPDAAARDRMQALGLTVHVVDDSQLVAADLDGKELIAVSDSNRNNETRIVNTIKNASIPIVSWENDLHPRLNFGAKRKIDEAHGETSITITSGTHPIVAGLSGEVAVVKSASNFGPSKALPDGESLATVTHNVSSGHGVEGETGPELIEDAVIVLEAGKRGTDGTVVPARRVGLPFEDGSVKRLNTAGRQIFDNSIIWALGASGETPPPPPPPPPPTPKEAVVLQGTTTNAFDTVLTDALVQLGFTVRRVNHNNVSQVGTPELLVVSYSVSSSKVADTVAGFGGRVFNTEPYLSERLGHARLDGSAPQTGDIETSAGIFDVLSADGPLATFTPLDGSSVLGTNADGSAFLLRLGEKYTFGFHDQTVVATVTNMAPLFQATLNGLTEPAPPAPRTAVVLAGSTTQTMDAVLSDALVSAGFHVRIVSDRTKPADVGTADLLAVSHTVNSTRAAPIVASFSGVVINTEPYLADDLGHADRVGPIASTGDVIVEGQAYDVLGVDGLLVDMTTRDGVAVRGTRSDGGAFVWQLGATWTIGVSEDTDPANLTNDFHAVVGRVSALAFGP